MPRRNPALLTSTNQVSPPGSTQWHLTDGFLHSVSATLGTATSATVDVFVSNAGSGVGVKIATLTLSAVSPSDGFSLPKEDSGWFFVRAEVTAVAGGNVTSVNACVGE